MRKLILTVVLMSMLVLPSGTTVVFGGCDPYGVSTLRGDAVYPPGWVDQDIIGIMPPDEYVFGVIDGAVLPQQFSRITAKVTNRVTSVPLQNGILMAVASYRLRTDYSPDMSTDPITVLPTDPPQADNVEEKVTISQSLPIALDLLPSDEYLPVTFDFGADPIPAGVVDLVLHIFFYGFAGEEKKEAVIVTGGIDLNEPMHLTYWNMRNYLVYNETAREIESLTPEELTDAYEQCDFSNYLQRTGHYYAGFSQTTASPLTPVAFIGPLNPGQHSRLIVLARPGPMKVRTYYPNDYELDFNDWKYDDPEYCQRSANNCNYGDTIYGGVVNQQQVDGFMATDPIIFRTIKSHFPDYNYLSCPPNYDSDGVQLVRELYKELPAGDPMPVPLEILDILLTLD